MSQEVACAWGRECGGNSLVPPLDYSGPCKIILVQKGSSFPSECELFLVVSSLKFHGKSIKLKQMDSSNTEFVPHIPEVPITEILDLCDLPWLYLPKGHSGLCYLEALCAVTKT